MAARFGALEGGGKVARVLADSLERAALNRENRTPLVDERLPPPTLEAMRAGQQVIVQAALGDGRWYGLPDVVLRTEKPGTWLWF